MPFSTHFLELKWRVLYLFICLVIAFLTSYAFSSELMYILTGPLIEQVSPPSTIDEGGRHFIFTNVTEAFTTHLLLSFYVAILFLFPLLLIQVWLFLAPGLYPDEERKLRLLFLLSPLCFILGCLTTYYLILPVAWSFFLSFEAMESQELLSIHLEAKISEYLDLSVRLFFVVGMLFQYPIVLLVLIHLNLITKEWMINKRKFFCIIAFIVAALFSPPDIFSQVMLATPLLFFYEVAILLLIVDNRHKAIPV